MLSCSSLAELLGLWLLFPGCVGWSTAAESRQLPVAGLGRRSCSSGAAWQVSGCAPPFLCEPAPPGDTGCVHLLAGQRHPAAPGPSLWVTSSQGIPSSLEPCSQVDLGRMQGGEMAPAAGTCPWEEWVPLWGRGGGSGTASWVSPWPCVRPPQPRGRGAAWMGNNAPLLTASSIVPENPF